MLAALQEKAYSNTAERIFPVTAEDAQDMTAVLMAEARQKLATAQAKQHSQPLMQQQQQKAAQQQQQSSQQQAGSSKSPERAQLKVSTLLEPVRKGVCASHCDSRCSPAARAIP
jgi:DNA primase